VTAPVSPDPDVIVVGDVMVDVSVRAGQLARGGDIHGEVRVRPAGAGANAAVWAASRGARVRLFGRVGDDTMGRLVCDELRDRGVDLAVAVDPRARTGAMLIVVDGAERSMVSDRGANGWFEPSDLPDRLRAGAVLVSGYLLLAERSHRAARAALERAEAPVVAVDAASWPLLEGFGPARFLEATRQASLILANRREAQMLSGATGEDAAVALARHYPTAVIKLGDRGALLCRGDQVVMAKTRPVRPVDPTGSGDAFDGVLLAVLAGGMDPAEALEEACAAGARAAESEDPWPAR
jgi:sugar/nucleoside kinase (ribokinase family)